MYFQVGADTKTTFLRKILRHVFINTQHFFMEKMYAICSQVKEGK